MNPTATLPMNAGEATVNGARSPDKETVTGLVAKGQDPEAAIATIFKEQGLLISLWIVFVYLLEAIGLKAEANIQKNYEHDQLDLDAVAKKGNFPYRPSDLFLRVLAFYVGYNGRCMLRQSTRLRRNQRLQFVHLHYLAPAAFVL